MLTEINKDRRRILGLTALTAVASLPWGFLWSSPIQLPIEANLPSLQGATTWLNSIPLSGEDLRGRVALFSFWTYTCINWRRTLPYLRAWARKYKEHGLVLVGIHSPEFPFERNVNNVQWAVKSMEIDYAVAMDNDLALWRAFNNEYWPALYFVDGKGRIRHHQFGEGDYDKSEIVIQQLLTEHGVTRLDRTLAPVEAAGPEFAADWRDLQSNENYLGHERTEGFESHPGMALGKPRLFTAPGTLKNNHWALSGDWITTKQAVSSTEANGRIAYQFHARDLNLVMGPGDRGMDIRFRVSLDGQDPGVSHGADVDEQGYGVVREARMYQLLRQSRPIADRRFEIEFVEPGVEAYSFTFG